MTIAWSSPPIAQRMLDQTEVMQAFATLFCLIFYRKIMYTMNCLIWRNIASAHAWSLHSEFAMLTRFVKVFQSLNPGQKLRCWAEHVKIVFEYGMFGSPVQNLFYLFFSIRVPFWCLLSMVTTDIEMEISENEIYVYPLNEITFLEVTRQFLVRKIKNKAFFM